MQSIASYAQNIGIQLDSDLRETVAIARVDMQQIKNQSLSAGYQIGQINAAIETNEWINDLISLVRGDDEINMKKIRAVMISLLNALTLWIQRDQGQVQKPYLLITHLINAKGELEKWNTQNLLPAGQDRN